MREGLEGSGDFGGVSGAGGGIFFQARLDDAIESGGECGLE